ATSGEDGYVKLWDTFSGQELMVFQRGRQMPGRDTQIPDGYGQKLGFTGDSRYLVTSGGAYEDEAKLLDVATGREVQSFPGTKGASVALSPDGRQFTKATKDGAVEVWDTETGSIIRTLRYPGGKTLSYRPQVALSSDGQLIAASEDDCITLWH